MNGYCPCFLTDKKSKKLLFDNNNIKMAKDNKIEIDLISKTKNYAIYKSFSSVLIGLLLLDDIDEP